MSSTGQVGESPAVAGEEAEEKKAAALSGHDFRIYNRLAERMDAFHQHFRQSWTLLWTACTTGRRPQGMSLKQLLDEGLQFAAHLTMHHGIEERHIFPVLARRMPEFQGGASAELLRQHRRIHAGLDGFEAYLRRCRAREVDFEMHVLRDKMASWGDVLWQHLDQEVATLGAENMRRYWTKEEVMRLPM